MTLTRASRLLVDLVHQPLKLANGPSITRNLIRRSSKVTIGLLRPLPPSSSDAGCARPRPSLIGVGFLPPPRKPVTLGVFLTTCRGLVGHLHLHQHVAGEELALRALCLRRGASRRRSPRSAPARRRRDVLHALALARLLAQRLRRPSSRSPSRCARCTSAGHRPRRSSRPRISGTQQSRAPDRPASRRCRRDRP